MVEDGVMGYWKINKEIIIFYGRVFVLNDKEFGEMVLKKVY